eukprot:704469-Pyramimonas_sp.AAC.1
MVFAPPGTGSSLPAPLWGRMKYESTAPADRSHSEPEARPYRYHGNIECVTSEAIYNLVDSCDDH